MESNLKLQPNKRKIFLRLFYAYVGLAVVFMPMLCTVHLAHALETKWASSHLTGSFANPTNAVGATNATWAGVLNENTSYTSRWAMENPSFTLSGTQTIRVLARKGSNSNNPSIAINLYENGSLVQSIAGNTSVTSTSGQTISGTFDASVITNPNNVEIEVVQTSAGGSPSARNAAQIDSIEWEVSLALTAPTVTTNAASDIESTTAVLNGTISDTGGEDATQHGFVYGTDATLTTVIATTTLGTKTGTGAFSDSVSDLSPNSTYYFRAYATNSAGSNYGSIESFTTLSTTPAPPSGVRVAAGIETTQLHWTTPVTDGGATITNYKIYRGTSPTPTTLHDTVGDVRTYLDTTSVTAGVTYYYRIKATNSVGDSAFSSEVFATPLETVARVIRLHGVRLHGVRLQ